MDTLMQSIVYAAHAYRERLCRTDSMEPFINHALNIVNFLIHRGGVENITWLAASLLSHIESHQFCNDEIRTTLGAEVESLAFRVVVAKKLKNYSLLGHDAKTVLLAECAFNMMCLRTMRLDKKTMTKYLEDAEDAVAQIGNVNDTLWTHYHDAVKLHKIKLD